MPYKLDLTETCLFLFVVVLSEGLGDKGEEHFVESFDVFRQVYV